MMPPKSIIVAFEVSAATFLMILMEFAAAAELHSVKKDSPTPELPSSSNSTNAKGAGASTNSTTASPPGSPPQWVKTDDSSLQTAFLAFAAIGILLIFFIIFRSYRLRTSRAERRYGVLGNRNTQELTPLPMAVDEDSADDEQTLFDASHRSGGETQPRMVL
ncbi:membrane protein FAM174A [Lutzomyia longipalpis]|uniref:membrane protein FAM174A n=1 Tax=Lutzomyia longipalpis TaxID=7200 RepID=UPI002483A651|nr:membrane protein FAM174A [Lutzomyia longipalpis]